MNKKLINLMLNAATYYNVPDDFFIILILRQKMMKNFI